MRRVLLVTPYTDAYQARLIRGLGRLGLRCIGEAHAGIADNLAYASLGLDQIRDLTREAMQKAAEPPDAVLAWCTNFAAAAVASDMEAELGLPFYDATLLGLWKALTIVGVDPSPAEAWGRLFQP